MKKKHRRKIIVETVNFIFGVLLFIAALIEIETTLVHEIKTLGLKSHHAICFYGVWHGLKALLNLVEAITQFQKIYSRSVSEGEEKTEK